MTAHSRLTFLSYSLFARDTPWFPPFCNTPDPSAAQKVFHHLWRGPATAAAVLVVLASRTTTIAASKLGGGLPLSVDHAPCVRLFHAGGDVGCRSPDRGGVDGPLVLVDSETVLDAIEVRNPRVEKGLGSQGGSERPK